MKQQLTAIILGAASILVASPERGAFAGDIQQARVDASQVQAGRQQFAEVCGLCHTNKPNKNNIGPSLFGVIGRHAGSAPGFSYSDAMRHASVTWNDETLDKYLADPKAFVPGNKMPYAGVKNEERRRDIIAYLHTLQ